MSTAHAFISATFDYDFKNLDLLRETLDTAGISKFSPLDANKRIAMVGDAVIDAILLRDWYPSKKPKGSGNKILQDVASNKNLARVARKIGLSDHLAIHAGQVHDFNGPSDYILATALEAVIGAIDRDSSGESNHEVVRAAMNKIGLTAAATE